VLKEGLRLAAARAGCQLISQEVAPDPGAMELIVLLEVLVDGLETGCESIQVSGRIAPVCPHLELLGSADLFRRLHRQF
jgi:hypothetical protein